LPVVPGSDDVLVWLPAACVRLPGRCQKIFVPRLRCRQCRVTHALLPAFVLAWRLDAAEAIGTVITGVAGGAGGVRPVAAGLGVPYTTARGPGRPPGSKNRRPAIRHDVGKNPRTGSAKAGSKKHTG
jgi:hypothetical protein